jgi:hypothetical protein
MSDAAWAMIVLILVGVIILILVKDWRLEPEPPVHRPDSADYKRGA